MNLSSLWNLVTGVRQPVVPLPDPDEPIRAEIFSIERLEQHGESLAAAQGVKDTPWKERPLSPRVRENGRVLLESYRAIAEAIQEERTIAPAAEWFVDNYYIVDKQLREIRKDLPPAFYRKLPKLADAPPRNSAFAAFCGPGFWPRPEMPPPSLTGNILVTLIMSQRSTFSDCLGNLIYKEAIRLTKKSLFSMNYLWYSLSRQIV